MRVSGVGSSELEDCRSDEIGSGHTFGVVHIASSLQRCRGTRADRSTRVRGNKIHAQPSDNDARVVVVQAVQGETVIEKCRRLTEDLTGHLEIHLGSLAGHCLCGCQKLVEGWAYGARWHTVTLAERPPPDKRIRCPPSTSRGTWSGPPSARLSIKPHGIPETDPLLAVSANEVLDINGLRAHMGSATVRFRMRSLELFLDQLKDGAGRRGSDIVNISSVAGRTARAGNGVYAATKWGLNGWSESLRQELLPDIRVTLIEPGVVATELPDRITHDETRRGVQQLYSQAQVTAEVITFVLNCPRHLAINDVLL